MEQGLRRDEGRLGPCVESRALNPEEECLMLCMEETVQR